MSVCVCVCVSVCVCLCVCVFKMSKDEYISYSDIHTPCLSVFFLGGGRGGLAGLILEILS